jgi:predicted TIM-barrel fold metal-dependent hydrolase
MDYNIVDADQHIIEPPDLWEQWLPKKFHDKAPKLVKDEEGGDAWQLGDIMEPMGLVAVQETRPRDLAWTGVKLSEVDPGFYEPERRLELMDEDGIDAAVFYPPQRTLYYFFADEDPAFRAAGIEAFNGWMQDYFCAENPSRLGAIAQIPPLGIEGAIEHLRSAKEKGFRGVSIGNWPSGRDALSAEDDPFWAVAEELGLPVHVHIRLVGGGAKRERVGVKRGGPDQLAGLATTLSAMPLLIAQTIFHGLFERFPKLTFVGAEAGVGWVPYVLGEMDDRYRRNRFWTEVSLGRLPSEYFKRNWKLGIVRDPFGVQNCHAVGVESILWSSDFPHHINDWPNSRYLINDMSLGLRAEDKRKIFCENAGRLYGFIE